MTLSYCCKCGGGEESRQSRREILLSPAKVLFVLCVSNLPVFWLAYPWQKGKSLSLKGLVDINWTLWSDLRVECKWSEAYKFQMIQSSQTKRKQSIEPGKNLNIFLGIKYPLGCSQ